MVFPVVLSIQELDHRETWALKTWCFWTVVLEKTLEVPWTARRSNQSILKEISPEYSLEGLMLKLKLQYFGHLIGKDPDAGKDWRQEEKVMTEDEMVEWHHRLDGQEFEQSPGTGDRQGRLVCCSPWDGKVVGHGWVTELNYFNLLEMMPGCILVHLLKCTWNERFCVFISNSNSHSLFQQKQIITHFWHCT